MFKKTKIAVATVALLGAATAQNVSAVAIDDSGSNAQVLIFPYYNTNNGFSTSFNIRNTKNETKAVKVRFRESKISNDVLDFNVYMSPFDHFSMAVTVNAAGQASLTTNDKTCTFPAIPATGVAFKGNVYKNTNDTDAREGYLEIIEMGVIPKTLVLISDTTVNVTSSVKHNSSGVPKDCSVIASAWNDHTFTAGGANAFIDGISNDESNSPLGINKPTGGLAGWSFLLDIVNGNAFVAMPAAIRNYQTTHAQHYRSDDQNAFLLPSLASGNVMTANALDDTGSSLKSYTWTPVKADDYATTTVGKAELQTTGGLSPSASGINPFPIAAVLAATGFTNDYLVDSTNNVGTDWVVTFPMRKHGIYSGVKYSPNTDPLNAAIDTSTVYKFETPSSGNITAAATFYNREEGTSIIADAFSPVSQSPLALLPREVNILSFGKNGETAVSKVLNSAYTKNVGVDFASGWGDVSFALDHTNTVDPLAKAITQKYLDGGVVGVPSIGFAAVHGNVTTAPGAKTATIGESVPHVFKRSRPVS